MQDKNTIKRAASVFLSLLMVLLLTACSGQNTAQGTDTPTDAPTANDFNEAVTPTESGDDSARVQAPTDSGDTMDPTDPADSADVATQDAVDGSEAVSGSNILVVFFSHTGENYNIGVIEKGNTHIIAEMIAEETGADMFEIQPVNPYPSVYRECTDVAKQEQNDNARPEFVGEVENMEQYDTIFIGYPIWWGDMPMIVYSFLESYDFSGKTIIPFCTHEGSGLAGTNRGIESACPESVVLSGLAVRGSVAQNQQDDARSDVLKWLGGLDY